MAGERYRIQSAEQAYVLDVSSSFVMNLRLNEQRVSILGYLSEQILAAEPPGNRLLR